MREKEEPPYIDFDSKSFLFLIIKWRKTLYIVAAAAIVLSVVFSDPFFITPKFKSTVIMFPVSSNSVSKSTLSVTGGSNDNVLAFGEAEQAEQMLQILNSHTIKENVIKRFDLMSHYGIEADSKFKKTRLYREFDSNIKFRRTEFMAIEIQVLDENPQVAAEIANHIAELYDEIKNDMQKRRAIEAFNVIEVEYNGLKYDIQSIEDTLTSLRLKGVHDYASQAEVINQQLAIAISKGNKPAIKALEEKLDIMALYGSAYVSLSERMEYEIEQLSLIKAKYKEAKVDATQSIPQKFVVDYAYPAEKKFYPIRWVIVLVTALSSLFFAMLVIIIVEKLLKKKQMKNSLK